MIDDAKQCPWCERWCLKDGGCNYIFACGLDYKNTVNIDMGCGKSWCWECRKKFCTIPTVRDYHDKCCEKETGFVREDYCPGGHSSHCPARY